MSAEKPSTNCAIHRLFTRRKLVNKGKIKKLKNATQKLTTVQGYNIKFLNNTVCNIKYQYEQLDNLKAIEISKNEDKEVEYTRCTDSEFITEWCMKLLQHIETVPK